MRSRFGILALAASLMVSGWSVAASAGGILGPQVIAINADQDDQIGRIFATLDRGDGRISGSGLIDERAFLKVAKELDVEDRVVFEPDLFTARETFKQHAAAGTFVYLFTNIVIDVSDDDLLIAAKLVSPEAVALEPGCILVGTDLPGGSMIAAVTRRERIGDCYAEVLQYTAQPGS